jgi:hypothetical protein
MFAAVASTSTSSFPVCSAAQKTKCLGSHLLHPLVLHTTMAEKKAGQGFWVPWTNPPCGEGVTGEEWRKAVTKKRKAFAKAQASHIELAKAHATVEKAGEAYDKAVKKAKKIQKSAELHAKEAYALE